MQIIIEIIDKDVSVKLSEKKKILDSIHFRDAHNLTDKLLPGIEKILQEHKIRPESLEKVSVKTNLGESYTSARIARTVAAVFNWHIKNART